MKADPFAKICRLCLTTGSKLMSIYNKKKKSAKPWSESIVLLLPMLEVHHKDGLPRKICSDCASALESYIDFRNRCVDNDQKLRQLIKQTQEVSLPPTDDEPVENILEPEMLVEADDERDDDTNNEVVIIDPKMEYYSSDDGEDGQMDDSDNEEQFYQYEENYDSMNQQEIEAGEYQCGQDEQSEETEQPEIDQYQSQDDDEEEARDESNEPIDEEEQPPTEFLFKVEAAEDGQNSQSPVLPTIKCSNSDQTTPTEEIEPPVQWELVPRDLPMTPPPSFEAAQPNTKELNEPRLIEIPQYRVEDGLLEIPQFNLQDQEMQETSTLPMDTATDKIVSFSIIKQLEAPFDSLPTPTEEYKGPDHNSHDADLELSHLSVPVSHDDVDDRAMEEIIVQVLGDPDNHSIDFGTDPADFLDEFSDLKTDDSMAPLEVFICKFCDAAFPKQMECQMHEHDEHDPPYTYRCSLCSNSYKSNDREQFIAHMKEVHKLKKPYICFHCSKKFKKRTGLRKHTVQHAGLKTFVCAICDKNFSRRNNLRHHLKIHAGERFGCSQCSKSFSTKNALQEHEDYHKNSQGYKCSLCGLLVTRKRRLVEHERLCFKKNYQNLSSDLDPENVMVINLDPNMTETDDLPDLGGAADIGDGGDQEFVCDVCMKGFTCKRVLKHHKLTHSAVKNYVCSYCDKAFLRRNELDRHVVSVHQQIKEHQCKICEKSFSRKDKLLRHERIHSKAS